ncbi:MAG: ATP-binding cassette domain-containing protein [Coriobacteriia bacterium]|nr:ATP-binding cassette domain-containing protein [Coriobacteriia bacterium]
MALIARGLGYIYGQGTGFGIDALRGVDFDLSPGELLVIAGATGSGKSTLLRLLAGLLRPSAGSVTVDGAAPDARSARGKVAIVFQNPESQFFAESVLADVAFGPGNLGADDPDVVAADALAAVGLDPDTFGGRSPLTLSGGEARRAAIAGALAMRAPYLLLDEPTAGLDSRGRRDVIAAVTAERVRAGVAVVTHDPDEFLSHADHVLALSEGAPVFDGSVAALFDAFREYESAGLRLPEVVRAQLLARERGAHIPSIGFEPREAARVLMAARGDRR